MEQKDVQNVENTEEVNTTENTETQTAEEKVEKTFTQSEFTKALKDEVTRKTKGMPSKEELKQFNEWKESQKTEAEKQTELTQKITDTTNENISLKQENQVLKSGVNADDVDYVLFKVSKMEGEFEDNLKDFLKSNPKYLHKEEVTNASNEDTGVAVTKNNEKAENGVTAILKEKHPELFK